MFSKNSCLAMFPGVPWRVPSACNACAGSERPVRNGTQMHFPYSASEKWRHEHVPLEDEAVRREPEAPSVVLPAHITPRLACVCVCGGGGSRTVAVGLPHSLPETWFRLDAIRTMSFHCNSSQWELRFHLASTITVLPVQANGHCVASDDVAPVGHNGA